MTSFELPPLQPVLSAEQLALLLAGPGGGLGQLDLFFTQRLNIPTTQVDPISGLGLMPEMDIPNGQRPGLAVVLGLGMREI